MAACWLALLLLLPTEVVGMAVRPKLTVFRTGPQLRPPARETPAADAGARDVMLKLYDISSPPLVSAFQALGPEMYLFLPFSVIRQNIEREIFSNTKQL